MNPALTVPAALAVDNQNSKTVPGKLPVWDEAESAGQKDSALQEIKDMEKNMRNSKYQTFEKSTYWHQQTMDELKQTTLAKEIIDSLQRIEAKLTHIETLL